MCAPRTRLGLCAGQVCGHVPSVVWHMSQLRHSHLCVCLGAGSDVHYPRKHVSCACYGIPRWPAPSNVASVCRNNGCVTVLQTGVGVGVGVWVWVWVCGCGRGVWGVGVASHSGFLTRPRCLPAGGGTVVRVQQLPPDVATVVSKLQAWMGQHPSVSSPAKQLSAVARSAAFRASAAQLHGTLHHGTTGDHPDHTTNAGARAGAGAGEGAGAGAGAAMDDNMMSWPPQPVWCVVSGDLLSSFFDQFSERDQRRAADALGLPLSELLKLLSRV